MFSAFVKYVGRSYHSHAEATKSAAASISDRSGRATSTGSARPRMRTRSRSPRWRSTPESSWMPATRSSERSPMPAPPTRNGTASSESRRWTAGRSTPSPPITAACSRRPSQGGQGRGGVDRGARVPGRQPARHRCGGGGQGDDHRAGRRRPEEKASLDWAQKRAAAQVQYQGLAKERHQGRAVLSVETDNPVVNHFVKAYGEPRSEALRPGRRIDPRGDMPSWSKGVSLWKSLHEPQAKVLGHL